MWVLSCSVTVHNHLYFASGDDANDVTEWLSSYGPLPAQYTMCIIKSSAPSMEDSKFKWFNIISSQCLLLFRFGGIKQVKCLVLHWSQHENEETQKWSDLILVNPKTCQSDDDQVDRLFERIELCRSSKSFLMGESDVSPIAPIPGMITCLSYPPSQGCVTLWNLKPCCSSYTSPFPLHPRLCFMLTWCGETILSQR